MARYSELAELDLARLGTTADADEIVDTAVTQPLIVAMGLITAGQLRLAGGPADRQRRPQHRRGDRQPRWPAC